MLNIIFIALFVMGALAAPIDYLPGFDGFDQLNFAMDSGYITVNETGGRHLFYWFAESQDKPETDPLIVWFTGGPGCSGLDAFMSENGPFRMNLDTKTLEVNGWSWNRHANVLWFEQPAGVGFSINEVDNFASDTQSAADNYVFLQEFLKQFPSLQGRELWLIGESYGGMYVPTLVQTILHGADISLADQLTGFMLGNPVLACDTASVYTYTSYPIQFNRYFYSGMISYTTYLKWTANNCAEVFSFNSGASNSEFEVCIQVYNMAMDNVGTITQQFKSDAPADVDTDNLFQDFCTGNATLDRTFEERSECTTIEMLTTAYLNRADVQAAIHARVGTHWATCTNHVDYDSDLQRTGLIPVLRDIFATKPSLNVMYYSGDIDIGTVPTQNTQACLAELYNEVSVIEGWRPWTISGWHAGYVEQFDRFSFATIKGAGHEAPQYQPAIAYNMLRRFMTRQNLKEEDDVDSVRFSGLTQGQMLRNSARKVGREAFRK